MWDDRREVTFNALYTSDDMKTTLELARRNGQMEGVHLMVPGAMVDQLAQKPEIGSSKRTLHVTPAGLKVFIIEHGNARQQLYTGQEGYGRHHQWRQGMVTVAFMEDTQI